MSESRSKTNALASLALTAQYSDSDNDSEGEGGQEKGNATPDNEDTNDSMPTAAGSVHKDFTPTMMKLGERLRVPLLNSLSSANSRENSPSSNLVSSVDSLAVATKLAAFDPKSDVIDVEDDRPSSPAAFHRTLEGLSVEHIVIPPEPAGRCSKTLTDKVSRLHEKMLNGADMNAAIQKRKDFRNPSIYEKLIAYCGIDEQGTNYPSEIYNPHKWGPESYYEDLARQQKEEMDKKERERRDKTKVEFVTGTVRKQIADSSADQRKKSKWDVAGNVAARAASAAVVSSSKPTVISAFGAIKKK